MKEHNFIELFKRFIATNGKILRQWKIYLALNFVGMLANSAFVFILSYGNTTLWPWPLLVAALNVAMIFFSFVQMDKINDKIRLLKNIIDLHEQKYYKFESEVDMLYVYSANRVSNGVPVYESLERLATDLEKL